MNSLKDGTVECFVASRENDLFLPKEDTIDHLDSMTIDLPGIYFAKLTLATKRWWLFPDLYLNTCRGHFS